MASQINTIDQLEAQFEACDKARLMRAGVFIFKVGRGGEPCRLTTPGWFANWGLELQGSPAPLLSPQFSCGLVGPSFGDKLIFGILLVFDVSAISARSGAFADG